jgi:hypothetical protein
MDNFDFRPRFSPIVNGTPHRYSVGAYRGKKRVTIAWFVDESSANEYLALCRRTNPYIKFDRLESLF